MGFWRRAPNHIKRTAKSISIAKIARQFGRKADLGLCTKQSHPTDPVPREGFEVYTSKLRPVKRAFEQLERCAVKVARTVLRGLGTSNGPWLPDQLTGLPDVQIEVSNSHCGVGVAKLRDTNPPGS